ncbi:MAG TPA: sugar phosphate nucleotidyltransferase [Bryobacteraceae bacterium]|nr:sugar phosphate nucleotidyltransferase [Bryobacteraceae bacterium]
MITALVMAGGSGQRMRSSGMPVAKPLVPVLGVSLLERNVHALLRAGVRRIIVAVPASLPGVAAFVYGRLTALTRAAGAEVVCFVEDKPLGNIGCAGLFRNETQDLLVVYADNLTTLDLRMIAAEHTANGADMTIATHKQHFHMPFGEVRIEDGDVRAYVEKPTYSYDVCSAVSVLGPAALAALPCDRPTGISSLVQSLIDHGRRVRSVPHAAPWIDVNDAASIPLAEALIAAHQCDVDLWSADPGEPQGLLCEITGNRVCLSLLPREADDPFMIFDDLDDESSRIRRFSVECCCMEQPLPATPANNALSPLAERIFAFARHTREAA